MWHLGIDLHRRTVMLATVHDSGEVVEPKTFGRANKWRSPDCGKPEVP